MKVVIQTFLYIPLLRVKDLLEKRRATGSDPGSQSCAGIPRRFILGQPVTAALGCEQFSGISTGHLHKSAELEFQSMSLEQEKIPVPNAISPAHWSHAVVDPLPVRVIRRHECDCKM